MRLALAVLVLAFLAGCDGCGTACVLDTAPHAHDVGIEPPVHGAEDLDAGDDAGDDGGRPEWRERIERIAVGVH